MAAALRNIVVNAAKELMKIVPATHRVLLIEPHTHFNHIFTFPRFAILAGHEHKAFVPYTGVFPPGQRHSTVPARVTHVHSDHVQIDRRWNGSDQLSFDYLVLATGTRLAAPSMMPYDDNVNSVRYLQDYQSQLARSNNIVIVGGGAVGVQMALDLKELYPHKNVTLVHSRTKLMHLFHSDLHDLLKDAFGEKGIDLITEARANVPPDGFPGDGSTFDVQLTNGQTIPADFVILATGQRPNNELISSLPPHDPEGLTNPSNGFVRVKPTLQIRDEQYPHIFAVGDIADTGVHKAARPGAGQAKVVASNIVSLMQGGRPAAEFERSPRAIHLSMGLQRNVVFRNPDEAAGQTEPTVIERTDGRADMNVEGMWERLNVPLRGPGMEQGSRAEL